MNGDGGYLRSTSTEIHKGPSRFLVPRNEGSSTQGAELASQRFSYSANPSASTSTWAWTSRILWFKQDAASRRRVLLALSCRRTCRIFLKT